MVGRGKMEGGSKIESRQKTDRLENLAGWVARVAEGARDGMLRARGAKRTARV